MNQDERTLLTVNSIAKELDVAVNTINNWYRWYNNPKSDKPEDTPVLPEFEQYTERGTRYWKKSVLPLLQAFKDWVPRGRAGVMGSTNKRYWGQRGKKE